MAEELYAHTPAEGSERWHLLDDHLEAVGRIAGDFAEPLGLGAVARLLGELHDLGKASPEFQGYLRDAHEGHPHRRGSVNHKIAGAVKAAGEADLLALLILGHHGGLPSAAEAKATLRAFEQGGVPGESQDYSVRRPDLTTAEAARLELGGLTSRLEAELALRLTYSCLVDADSLDTESHFKPAVSADRHDVVRLKELIQLLTRSQDALMQRAPDTEVNRVRRRVYEECLAAAEAPPGVFSLTVPTGGGKTLSSLAFALRHAQANGLERVICAIPYTSIIEQTCDVFRSALPAAHAVLEHHSAIDESGANGADDQWRVLASENWDSPVVVTTTVQFFESLFGNRPGKCRKVHRMARSVIVLDEVQTLPGRYLEPMVDALRALVERYGASVVLCTATQPALQESLDLVPGFASIQEITSTTAIDFERLARVEYHIDLEPVEWADVACCVRDHSQCLIVVNTKSDAISLLEALDDPDALHLSTRLCPEHRTQVLNAIRARLKDGVPCRVVSTQVVEAGVDLDFPVVYRAVGPLDRIVQAAGRCNREGTLEFGHVHVFNPNEGSQPRGAYRTAVDHALMWLGRDGLDLGDPSSFPDYFRCVYGDLNTDAKNIQELRAAFDFPKVADRFRMIDEDTVSVLVSYDLETVERICGEIEVLQHVDRRLWRQIQRHSVALRRRDFDKAMRGGLVFEVAPDSALYRWFGEYDEVKGLTGAGPDPADLIQ
ncbi:MAG: CRISPR-associated helicase Cas3' [Actinomycetota bacterium]|nr:CRISPR-associated helicase Cas3' [Actinomycetota bacterium]